ncbi:DUF3306 domain-containing protein [Acuticoccus sediminis]|uniref:DUF3306 domain-containing protein n=1 Tax=Acuticoccus sediminis TaxID=2184697 RepID=UPI001CFD1D82|nr:DUF3306 domain-containing protein [Acuticoccus sediminis]
MTGVLERWSRRKRGLEQDPAAEPPLAPEGAEAAEALAPETGGTTETAPAGPESEAEFLERTGLADPDALAPDADFSAYLKGAVPDAIRRRAMRRLWRSNPVFANLDGLVDYAEDYTDAATSPGVLQTAYAIGRGFRRAAARVDAALPADAPAPDTSATTEGMDAPAGSHLSDVAGGGPGAVPGGDPRTVDASRTGCGDAAADGLIPASQDGPGGGQPTRGGKGGESAESAANGPTARPAGPPHDGENVADTPVRRAPRMRFEVS